MECDDKFVHRLSLLDRSLMTSANQPITEKNFLMDMLVLFYVYLILIIFLFYFILFYFY